jgi:copper(I)-binding protein
MEIPALKWQVLLVCGVLGWVVGAAHANTQPVEIKDAWVRGTVAGQKASGAFMSLSSRSPARLVAAASPVADVVEIHNMKTDGGVMRMFAVDGIELPANRTVVLAPGGFHLMLMGLKRTLKPGERVPLRLMFELAGGKRETIELDVEVRQITGERTHSH